MNHLSIQVRVYGDTVAELEKNATAKARDYLGPGYTTEIGEYVAHETAPGVTGYGISSTSNHMAA